MEVISSGDDEVFGQFDFNDNTPVLEPVINKTMAMSPTSPQQQVNQQIAGGLIEGDNNIIIPTDLTDISPTKKPTSPIPCPSNTSSTSGSNATYLQGGASSLTDENTNNDFFYDDEFTGFDDNLCEGAPDQAADGRMLDSADINNILTMSRLVPGAEDSDSYIFNRIATSKSDSCLYHGDMSMSSDGAMVISQDQSFSEGDVVSSSDLSELRSEPLFSPPPDEDRQTPTCLAQLSPMDSLVKSGSLSSSLLTEDEKYTFDWTANKEKYMISCVHDEDSSLQDSCPSGAAGLRTSLSSWAQRSSGQITWSSHSSSTGSSKESGTESPLPSGAEAASLKPSQTPRTRTKSLTSWATIKKGDSDEKLNNTPQTGLTSWRSLKEESKNKETVETGVKSKSLPDLPKKSKFGSNESIQEENTEMKKSSTKETSLHVSQLEELLAKKNVTSGCLLELFQRLKLQQEDILSPGAAQNMMMGTWSMSDASSGILLSPERSTGTPAPGPPPLSKTAQSGEGQQRIRLTSWNTMKNLNLSRSKSVTSSSNDSLIISSSNNACSSVSMSSSSNKMKHSFGCGTSTQSVGVGSSMITSRDVTMKETRDFSSQFPPRFSDSSIQTSFEERERVFDKKSKSLQTSMEGKRPLRQHKSLDLKSPPPKPPRQPHLTKTRSADSSPITRPSSGKREKKKVDSISNKMSESILNNLTRLPDLSFLNRNITEDLAFLNGGMTRSASSSDEFTKDPIFRPVSSMTRFSKAFSIFHPLHDDLPRKWKHRNQERNRSSSVDPTTDFRRSSSSSREPSPVMNTRRRSRKGREASPSDFGSSSSSGIDPGSFDSQGTRTPQYFSDLALFSPSTSDCNTASSAESDTIIESLTKTKINPKRSNSIDDIKGLKFNMPKVSEELKPKDVRIMQLKEEAKLSKQMETAELNGSGSRGRKKSTDYIDIKDRENVPKLSSCDSCERCSSLSKLSSLSPTTSWNWSPTTSMESSHNNNSDPKTECVHFQVCQRQTTCRTVVMSGICEKCSPTKECMCQLDNAPCAATRREAWVHQMQCFQNDDRSPLKPCLVKRRKARKAPMKHRSWSDTRDLQVMRYSQEGQTRYQLIIPPCGDECVHGLSSKCMAFTSLPTDVLLKTIGEQVVAAAGGKLTLQHPSNQCAETNECEVLDHKAGCCITVPATTTVTTSPEPIPTMPCPCCQSSAGCTSSTCSSVTHDHLDGRRARKSVSFSEEISYHSPYPSPHPSPKKQVHTIVPSSAAKGDLSSSEAKPIYTATRPKEASESVTSLSSEDSGPPNEFTVSPCPSPPSSIQLSPSRTFSPTRTLQPKHELVLEVIRGTEIVISYFAAAKDSEEKLRLGSTAHNDEIGHLVLRHICPPVYAMLMDGLNPQVRSLFGKMRNNVWKVIEDSAEQGPTVKVVAELVRQLKTIDFLSTSWLRFNAFVFGLLNHKSLDFWLDFLRTQDMVLSRHYGSDSFLQMSHSTGCRVFNDITIALQPLALLPFRLDFDFELKQLHEKQQKHMADQQQEKVSTENSELQMSTTSSTASMNSFSSFTSSTPSAAAMGKQTKELFQQGSRLLAKLPTQTSLLSWGSSTLGSMFSSAKAKALTGSLSPTGVKTVPELKGINDCSDVTSGTSDEVFKSAEEPKEPIGVIDAYSKIPASNSSSPVKSKAIPVVKNNEILAQEYYEDSLEGSQLISHASEKINRIAKQMVGISSPERKIDSAYKRGVTEYTFEDDIMTSVRDMKAKILADCQNSVSCDSLEISGVMGSPKKSKPGSPRKVMNSSGLRQCEPGSLEVEVKRVPQISLDSDSGIDDYRLEACAAPMDCHLPTRQEVVKNDPTSKRWSDTEATQWMSHDATSKLETSITKAKKRWSTFGPSMIKLFDKMLLPEEKEIQPRPVPPPKPKRMTSIDVTSRNSESSEQRSSSRGRAPLTRANTTGEDVVHH